MAYKKNISGSIDSYGWFRYLVEDTLNQHKSEEVHLVIMSPGGAVNEAIAISDLLADHGNVTIEFSGLAASAATWLAFGAKRVIMHEDTLWLCHKSSAAVCEWSQMNEKELDAYIEKLKGQQKSLQVIDAIIAKKYLDRAASKGKTLQDIVDLMQEERYLDPKDCLAWGFVDEVLPSKSSVASNILVTDEFLNAIHLPLMNKANATEQTVQEEPATPAPSVSLVDAIVQRIKDFITPKKADETEETQEEVNEETTQVESIMNKDFISVNALLGVEGIEVADNKVTLTVDQLTAIENSLKATANAEKALDEVSPKVKNMTGIANKVAAVTMLLDHAPVAPAVANKPTQENSKEVHIENADGINDLAREMYK